MDWTSRRTLLLLGLGILLAVDLSHSFVPWQPPAVSLATSRLFSAADASDKKEDDEEDYMDYERERKRLESLLGSIKTEEESSSNKLLSLPLSEWKQELKTKPPMLTTIGRERMEMEITLLESLAYSDDAIPELWNLWYNARGPEAAKELHETEALVAQGQPEAWTKAELMLKKLIAKEGIHWAEPVNRLATLMFLQQRHKESKELCEIVLTLKPWHFGALSGMVMVQQGLQDTEGMLEYARKRMPPLPKKGEQEKEPPKELGELETRQMWVDRMLDLARAKLLGLEMEMEESFSELDKHDKKDQSKVVSNNTSTNVEKEDEFAKTDSTDTSTSANTWSDDEDDAWQ